MYHGIITSSGSSMPPANAASVFIERWPESAQGRNVITARKAIVIGAPGCVYTPRPSASPATTISHARGRSMKASTE